MIFSDAHSRGLARFWELLAAMPSPGRHKAVEKERVPENRETNMELQFRNTLDRMLEGVQILDFGWRYLYVNDAVAKHGKNTREQMLGRTIMELYPGIERTEAFRAMERCMHGRTPQNLDNEFVYPDGSRGWFELSIQPAPEGIVVLSIDITARKRAEAMIRKLYGRLEEKVKQRTAQLESANRELEAFTYSVSHDLRAPLRAIDGFTKILCEEYGDRFDEEAARLMGVIMDNARHMGQLIDDLLAFSRFGKKGISLSPLSMNDLAGSVLNEFKGELESGRIKINLRTLDPAPGDPSMIRQVLVNLISNAIKYSRHKESPEIGIGSRVNGEHVEYYVRDNGAGFDMQYAHKLFGVFQRLHSASEFEGTGVGLAIVQRIVARHGGKVWAEGKVNEGAAFFFSLPARNAALAGNEETAEAVE